MENQLRSIGHGLSLRVSKNKEESYIVKVVIKKDDGSEEWVKREGEDISDYEVLDRLLALNYRYSDAYQIIV